MPPAKKLKEARSHADSIHLVCAVCWRKSSSARKVSEKLSDQIKKFFSKEFDLKNYYHPKVVCDVCRLTLSALSKDPDDCKRRLPPTADYKSLLPPPPNTRSGSDMKCKCKICDIARLDKYEYKKHCLDHSRVVGRPRFAPLLPKSKSLVLCSRCFAVKGKGFEHRCTKVSKQMNIVDITKSSSEKTKGKVASNILKDLCIESGVSLKGGKLSLSTGGKKLSVQLGNPGVSIPKPKFTHDSLKRLQAANNYSDRAV